MIPDPNCLPQEFADALVMARDRLGRFAKRTLWYPEIGSTNDVAAALAEDGAHEGVVVIADRQTAGRGRFGREWASPAGAGLYASIVLRPSPAAAALLTIAAGVAIADGIGSATGLQVQLKWPNDVHVEGRKLAGILAEGAASHVVLGVGINLMPAAYPPDVAARATSLEAELGRRVDRGLVFVECLAALAARYRELHLDGGASAVRGWRERASWTLGRRVEWDAAGEHRLGSVEDIGEDGALLVRSGHQVVRIRSGEVRWL